MIQLVKRPDLSHGREITMRLIAVVCSLVFASLFMLVLGYNPLSIFSNIIVGSTGTAFRIQETINKAIPLAALSLGVAVSFKMKFWNIGAEGQFYLGALCAAYTAYRLKNLPMYLLLPLMLVAGFIGGGLWGLVPALLKLKYRTNEILVTLMLNYVAVKVVTYLQYGPWKDPNASGFAKMPRFADTAVLPKVLGIHIGWLITLLIAAAVYIMLGKTKLGYQVAVIGESETTARYAGISVSKITLIAVLISGGICGIAGFMQASAIERSVTDQLSAGLGFTSVITAWLARLSAPMIIVVSLLFAGLLQGSIYLQTAMQIPSAVADVLQGIILFFVLGSELFLNYKVVFRKKDAKEAA